MWWALIQCDFHPHKERRLAHVLRAQKKDCVRTSEEAAICKPSKEILEETKPVDTLILNFETLKLRENKFLLLKPPKRWYFPMAALAKQCWYSYILPIILLDCFFLLLYRSSLYIIDNKLLSIINNNFLSFIPKHSREWHILNQMGHQDNRYKPKCPEKTKLYAHHIIVCYSCCQIFCPVYRLFFHF